MFLIVVQVEVADIGGTNDRNFCIRVVGENNIQVRTVIFDDGVITRFIRFNKVSFGNDCFDIIPDRTEVKRAGLGDELEGFGRALSKAFVVLFEACFEINGFTDIKRFFVFVFEDIDAWTRRQRVPKILRFRREG